MSNVERRHAALRWCLVCMWALSPVPARAQGPAEPAYAAVVTGGVTLAEPSGVAGAAPGTTAHGTTAAHVALDTELRPLDLGLGWIATFGLRLARQPLLAFVTPGIGAGAEPIFRNGTLLATELRFAKSSRNVELAAASRAGATRISLSPVTLTENGVTRDYAAAANDRDAWALFLDTRLDLRWYDQPVALKRQALETLDPLLHAAVGLRHDERFHRKGDLQPFNDPTGRVFFNVGLHPFRRGAVSAGGSFGLEGALRGANRLPSGFLASIGATVNLRRLRR